MRRDERFQAHWEGPREGLYKESKKEERGKHYDRFEEIIKIQILGFEFRGSYEFHRTLIHFAIHG